MGATGLSLVRFPTLGCCTALSTELGIGWTAKWSKAEAPSYINGIATNLHAVHVTHFYVVKSWPHCPPPLFVVYTWLGRHCCASSSAMGLAWITMLSTLMGLMGRFFALIGSFSILSKVSKPSINLKELPKINLKPRLKQKTTHTCQRWCTHRSSEAVWSTLKCQI